MTTNPAKRYYRFIRVLYKYCHSDKRTRNTSWIDNQEGLCSNLISWAYTCRIKNGMELCEFQLEVFRNATDTFALPFNHNMRHYFEEEDKFMNCERLQFMEDYLAGKYADRK